MPSLTRNIPHGSDLAKKILREVQYRVRMSETKLGEKSKKWKDAEDKALAFIPERDVDAVRRNSRENGLPQYTTIQIPYSYAVLMAAHTYVTSVFLGRSPVFQFGGRHGESSQNVQAVEALIDYQMLVGQMLVPIYIWLYDFLKYGVGIMGLYWEDRYESIAEIQEVPKSVDPLTGEVIASQKVESRMVGRTYSGNRVHNIQPWDFLWDVRYPAWEFQKGEYVALRFSLMWNEVKRREFSGFYMNTKNISKGTTADGFGSGASDSDLLKPESNDSTTWSGDTTDLNLDHPMMVKGYECYIEIIPKEWGLAESTFPEKWVFTCTGDFKTLIGAQPLGAWHCKFPCNVLSLEPEGYGLTTRGLPEILEPVQNTIDWLLNSHFFNIRAALNNKFIIDPSRIVMKDALSPLPGGVIRLKPAAYGTDPHLAIAQMQVTDVTQAHLRDLPTMLGIGERVVGINDQIMGMLNTGGRKTATEVRTSTSFGVNRLKTISEFASASGFDQLAAMLVQNTQQYYDQEQVFKIAGDLVGSASANFMMVNPSLVQGNYDYVPVDGTLPIDRYAQANLWMQMFAQVGRMPQVMAQYDLGKMFSWVAQLAGMKNINQFKIQAVPDGQLAAQAQAGNSVPMEQAAQGQLPAMGNRELPAQPAPLQIPNMGPSA